jgi:hypothetical protein
MKCPSCGYDNATESLTCNLCGMVLRRTVSEPVTDPQPAPTASDLPPGGGVTESIHVGEVPQWFLDATDKGGPHKYCLVCFPFDPLPLTREKPIVIGRSNDCGFVLPVGMVSRRHAEVYWNGESYEIRDLGSSNGTLVNGKKVSKLALKDGDTMDIGPYTITMKAYQGSIEDVKAAADGVEITTNFVHGEAAQPDSMFSGTVGQIKMEEVIQLIEFNKKTGTLEVKSGGKTGTFHFRDGQILDAAFHTSEGDMAVARLLSITSGKFQFKVGVPDCTQTLFEPTSKILLDALRKIDEFKAE